MPAYDYTCTRCGQVAEVIHGIHAPGPTACPNCGAEGTMRKGFTAPAIHFKGSGWAKKDRSTSSSAMTKAKAAEGSGESTSKESGSENSGSSDSGSGDKAVGDKKASAASSELTSTAKVGSSGGSD